jgi:(p)ppGpp synthase/HD superfamily hydrolase
MEAVILTRSEFDFQVNHDLPTTSEALARKLNALFSRDDFLWIEAGMATAKTAHAGQCRADGSTYVIHPFRVALLVLRYEPLCTREMIVACCLHDALEDTSLKEHDIIERFGEGVADLVAGVTRYRPLNETPEQRRDGKLAKWRQTMKASREIRVIKTFDYCDNVISWKFISPDSPGFAKIPRWLMEAKDLYLPLAQKTNADAAQLIQRELENYLARGHKLGTWRD